MTVRLRECAVLLFALGVMLTGGAATASSLPRSPTVGIATMSGGGYVEVTADGGVVAHQARFRGSPRAQGIVLRSRVAGIAATETGGYLVATADGRVFGFGAVWHGSPRSAGIHLRSPVVGIATTQAGGYLLATARGDVYAFGAAFHGSPRAGHDRLRSPVVGIAVTARGGYLLTTAAGNIYPFATAWHRSPHSRYVRLTSKIVGLAATPAGGYLLASAGGTIYPQGAAYFGSSRSRHVQLPAPITGIAAIAGGGYREVTADGHVLTFRSKLSSVGLSSSQYPVGTYVDTTATNALGCEGIRIGSSFDQTSAGAAGSACTTAATQAWVLVLNANTLAQQAFVELPQGSGAGVALQNDLKPYIADYQQHLVVLVSPAGCCSNDPVLSNAGFSAVWNLVNGAPDLAKIGTTVTGAVNNGSKLTPDKASVAGEVAGYLLPVNAGPQQGTYAFNARDYLPFDTKTAQATAVGAPSVAPHDQDVDALVDAGGQALNVGGAATSSGQALIPSVESDLPSQRWRLEASAAAPGYFKLLNVNSQLCADVTGGTLSGALEQWTCASDSPNQLFKPEVQSGGSYALVTDIDQKSVLTVKPDNTVIVSADAGAQGQLWHWQPMVGTPQAQATGILDSVTGPALDLAGGAQTAGTAGTLAAAATESDGTTQQWLSVPAGGTSAPTGSLALVNIKTGMCLSAPANAPGTSPDQEACAPGYDRLSQLWVATPSDGADVLVNAANQLTLTVSSPSLGATRHKRKRKKRLRSTQAAAQSMWFTSRSVDVKDGFPATGANDFYCSDYVPSNQANLYPYLVPEGDSYAYRNISNDVHVGANEAASNAWTGKLSTLWSNYNIHGDYAERIQQECTGANPGGWSVSSTGAQSVTTTSATIGAQITGYAGNVSVHADYGASVGRYTSQSPTQTLTGNKGTQPVNLTLTGLQPNTTYHFRIVAAYTSANTPNAYSGADQTFTTSPYGTPLTLVPNSGTAAQRWVFRPLQTTETMSIGHDSFSSEMPISWSGFALEGVKPSQQMTSATPQVFYTNTGTSVDATQQSAMASALTKLQGQAGDAVLVQSINQPKPTTASWNDITTQIAKLGGTTAAFNALDGTGDYALIGCPGCTQSPEANSAITFPVTHRAGQDALSGLLGRTATSGWQPQLSNPGSSTDYSLAPLAMQAPTAWPVPAGVTASANAAALAWIAGQLSMTAPSCYAYPTGQPDVRSAYCNVNEDFGNDETNLNRLTYPANASGLGFGPGDLTAEQTELDTELTELATVKNLITNLQAPINGSAAPVEAYLQKTAQSILNNQSPSNAAQADTLTLLSFAFSSASYAFPETPLVGGALGIAGAGLSLIDSFLAQPDGSSTLGAFQDKAASIGADLADRLQAASGQLGQVFSLLAGDPTKLRIAYDNAKDNALATSDWAFTTDDISKMQSVLEDGADQELWTSLMPAEYSELSVPSPPQNKTIKQWQCLVYYLGKDVYAPPLENAASSGVFAPVKSVSANGAPQAPRTLALGTNIDLTKLQDVTVPTSAVTDSLFKPLSAGGVGLFKPWFYSAPGFTVTTGDQSACGY